MRITDNPFQTLDVKFMNDDVIALVERNLIDGKWIPKVIMMNKREQLEYQAIQGANKTRR